jgi:hypothetical protein
MSKSGGICPKEKWRILVQVVIISLLMSPLLGHRPSLWITYKKTGHNPPRGPNADCWVLMTANAAGTNALTCFPKLVQVAA